MFVAGRIALAGLAAALLGVTSPAALADDTISHDVRQIVAEHFRVTEDQVTEDSYLADDFGADDLDLVELVMAFDEAFGTLIPDTDIDYMQTVGDAVRIVTEGQP